MSAPKSSVVLTAAVLLGASAASAQVEERNIYPGVERAVYASVLDRQGAPVTTLRADDFVVREGGIEREVLRVSRAADPLRIAVLVDTSHAMQPHVNDLRGALRRFFRQMQGHEIALLEFGDRPTVLVNYTTDARSLDAGVGRVFARSGTGSYVLDAIVDVSRDFRRREGARPIIVVITAEGPEFSQRAHQVVLDDVRRANATLHSFVLTRPRRASLFSDAAREREFTLSKGARMTGGRREDLLTSMSLADRLQSLAAELENQYQVVYARPDVLIPSGRIDVGVNQTRLTVRAPRSPQGLRVLP